MSKQSAAANVHPFIRTSPAPEPPDASDPASLMRREITLLRIEVEHLRAKEDEARKIKEFLLAYVDQVEHLRASRDQWQREAEHLSALLAQVPHWSLFLARCCLDASKAWRKLTAIGAVHCARAGQMLRWIYACRPSAALDHRALLEWVRRLARAAEFRSGRRSIASRRVASRSPRSVDGLRWHG